MRSALTTVAVLGGALGLSACGSAHRTTFASVSRVGALSVPTPAGFHARAWPGGVVISDRPGALRIPCTTNDGCAGGLAAAPGEDELVVYETTFMEPSPALTFPLSLENLEQRPRLTEWDGAGSIAPGGSAYAVNVWLGPKAPAADRSALLAALQTIKPS